MTSTLGYRPGHPRHAAGDGEADDHKGQDGGALVRRNEVRKRAEPASATEDAPRYMRMECVRA